MTTWIFGVEIEIRAVPHTVRNPLSPALYYGKLAAALRNRGLRATADDLNGNYTRHPEHYDKWWITRDGSLGDPTDLIALEAVSPILEVRGNWEDEIDTFWDAARAVFHMPQQSARCGSHVHISPGRNKRFKLSTLKKMAYGIVLYEDFLGGMLVPSRVGNDYCKFNSIGSTPLTQCRRNFAAIAQLIKSADHPEALKTIMQDTRYVLWNFDNIVAGKSGTVEFRGGRHLRGEVRTKRWIAFAIGFLRAAVDMNDIERPGVSALSSWSTAVLYEKIKSEAAKVAMGDLLPNNYNALNESVRYVPDASMLDYVNSMVM